MTEIRRAVSEDVAGIAMIVQDVWQQEIDLEVCRGQLEDSSGAIWVAAEAGAIVGFVSAFLTVDQAGLRRWEVDLLAVRQTSRGYGLGQKLVAATWGDAQRHQARLARAAVRVANFASQGTFKPSGYVTDGRVHKLLIWSPEACTDQISWPQQVTCLPVDTLTYCGLWLEGLTSPGVSHDSQRRALKAARALSAQQGRLNIGALIPGEEEFRLSDDLRTIAADHGEYHWWQKLLAPRKPGF